MKLRNKKTGEIITTTDFTFATYDDGIRYNGTQTYNSLEEFNEDWEDYEEPGEWCITMYGGVSRISKEDKALIPELKEIGNYFNDKESACDALDKLKAYKRLKEKGFRFNGINEADGSIKTGLSKGVPLDASVEFYNDMSLLFEGEA